MFSAREKRQAAATVMGGAEKSAMAETITPMSSHGQRRRECSIRSGHDGRAPKACGLVLRRSSGHIVRRFGRQSADPNGCVEKRTRQNPDRRAAKRGAPRSMRGPRLLAGVQASPCSHGTLSLGLCQPLGDPQRTIVRRCCQSGTAEQETSHSADVSSGAEVAALSPLERMRHGPENFGVVRGRPCSSYERKSWEGGPDRTPGSLSAKSNAWVRINPTAITDS